MPYLDPSPGSYDEPYEFGAFEQDSARLFSKTCAECARFAPRIFQALGLGEELVYVVNEFRKHSREVHELPLEW